MGINIPKTHETEGYIALKPFVCCTYYNDHACIWVTHYERNISKEERFPLWTPKDFFLCLKVLL